jgi:nucleoside-diphosphate-sugar epimerase/UDP-2,3-diacylglucosamine pyrophosphatase LpxH
MVGYRKAECRRPAAEAQDDLVLSREDVGDQILVVSDLHLGSGREPVTGRFDRRENFFADETFCRFLKYYGKNELGRGLLVFNGDTFDFVRVMDVPRTEDDFREWSDDLLAVGRKKDPKDLRESIRWEERIFGLFTGDLKSVWRIHRMIRGHRVFFDSLASWVRRGGRIVFVQGNHDLELQWSIVRTAILQAIKKKGRSRNLDGKVFFALRSLRVENLHLEHGHSLDPATRVVGERASKNDKNLRLPLGSIVNRYLINKLEDIEPFLNNIKPMLSALQSIVLRHPWQCFKKCLVAAPFVFLSVRPYWLFFDVGVIVFFGALAVSVGTLACVLGAILVPTLGGPTLAPPATAAVLLLVFLGIFAPFLDALVRVAFRKRNFEPADDYYGQELFRRLKKVDIGADYGTAYGVIGHSHRADIQVLNDGRGPPYLYLNSGTWAPIWHRKRPNLRGGTEYSFLRFVWFREKKEFRHQTLVWRDDRNSPVENVIMARNGSSGQAWLFDAPRPIERSAMEKAFITGVNGFIGSHLAEELLKRGYEVTGMVRPSSDTRSLVKLFQKYGPRFRLVLGDVRDPASLEAGMAEADVVYHLAAVLMGTRKSDYFNTNFDGTCNVLDAAFKKHQKSPLKRVVITSSIAAAGPSPSAKPIDETFPRNPISWYGKSKDKAEVAAEDYMGKGLPITIVRPVLVHGVRDRDFSGGIFPWIARGISPRIGIKRKSLSMISVGDVVDGMIAAATSPNSVGEIYFLSDPQVYRDKQVAAELATAMNKWCRIPLPVPHAYLWINGFISELIHIFNGQRPTMTRDKAREFSQRFWTVTPDKAKEKAHLGWESKISFSQGLQIAVADWRRRRTPAKATSELLRYRVLKTALVALAIGIVVEGLAAIGDWWTFDPPWLVLIIVFFGFGGVLGGASMVTAARSRWIQFLAGGFLGFVGELANALWLERWELSPDFVGWLPQNDWIISLALGLPLGFVPVIINSVVCGLYRRNCRLGCGPVEEGI